MLKTASLVVVGLVAGLAVATWWGRESPPLRTTDDAAVGARLDALEIALDAERERRFALEDEIAALEERFAALTPSVGLESSAAPRGDGGADEVRPEGAEALAVVREGFAFRRGLGIASDEELIERFTAAGLSPDRAQWILRRTEELRLEALQAEYDAARGVATADGAPRESTAGVLRAELGDADYELYLQALGRPTSVYVGDVLARSSAEQAGLQAGDRVVAYAGTRVFDMRDLNALVLEGEPGETVAVEVLRNGQTVQLYLARGPIGIAGGGRGPRLR